MLTIGLCCHCQKKLTAQVGSGSGIEILMDWMVILGYTGLWTRVINLMLHKCGYKNQSDRRWNQSDHAFDARIVLCSADSDWYFFCFDSQMQSMTCHFKWCKTKIIYTLKYFIWDPCWEDRSINSISAWIVTIPGWYFQWLLLALLPCLCCLGLSWYFSLINWE